MKKLLSIIENPNIVDENGVSQLRSIISHLDVSRNLLTDEGLNAISQWI